MNLEVQISWQAQQAQQHFVILEVQISWQRQRSVRALYGAECVTNLLRAMRARAKQAQRQAGHEPWLF